MARHAGNDPSLEEHASRASALLAARAAGKAAPQPPESQDPHPRGLVEFIRRNIVYIASVVAVVVIVTLGILVIHALMPPADRMAEAEAEGQAGYVSPYDWTKLDRADKRYRYIVDGEVKSRLGIDVSENQHEIDWEAVAADGIDFAMVRLGYRGATAGDLYLDAYYYRNLDGARAAGLDCGVYFFSQARTAEEAVEEADYVLEYLGGTPLEYPIAFDSEAVVLDLAEARTTGLSVDEMTAIYEAFCNRVEEAGYDSLVYGNSADLSRYRYDSLAQDKVWWAEYGTATPAANIDIVMWQYSNSGEVAGVPVPVDMNIDLSRVLD